MKRTLLIYILAILAIATLTTLSGCGAPYINTWTAPNGTYHADMGTYRQSRNAKLLVHYDGAIWHNIARKDCADNKKPYILRKTDTEFMVEVGHPKKFVGTVISVEVWLDDIGPIQAQGRSDGKYYFTVSTRDSRVSGLWARFDGLSPGYHVITARIAWQHTRGPYYDGPASEDFVQIVEGWVEFDPWHIR
ncbi:MAG: hypothetical protein WCT13_02430 [Patescibacteria group bacterium]